MITRVWAEEGQSEVEVLEAIMQRGTVSDDFSPPNLLFTGDDLGTFVPPRASMGLVQFTTPSDTVRVGPLRRLRGAAGASLTGRAARSMGDTGGRSSLRTVTSALTAAR